MCESKHILEISSKAATAHFGCLPVRALTHLGNLLAQSERIIRNLIFFQSLKGSKILETFANLFIPNENGKQWQNSVPTGEQHWARDTTIQLFTVHKTAPPGLVETEHNTRTTDRSVSCIWTPRTRRRSTARSSCARRSPDPGRPLSYTAAGSPGPRRGPASPHTPINTRQIILGWEIMETPSPRCWITGV